ncbi:procathepsin L-like [Ptychodera flava]|uniref:procathepsin L-like n=1 Tax=Ptychodera flava TaxID=63121 RepID=UPI00396A7C37
MQMLLGIVHLAIAAVLLTMGQGHINRSQSRMELMSDREIQWELWKHVHSKRYGIAEEKARRRIWNRNMDLIVKHNSRFDSVGGQNGFVMAMNKFGDMNNERPRVVLSEFKQDKILKNQIVDVIIPESVDWRTKGVVNQVRNQGMIGSVGSFVIADAVASFQAIRTGDLHLLSVDEVYQCCSNETQVTNNAFRCVHNINGLCEQATYDPSPGICNNASCPAVAQVPHGTKFVTPSGDEVALAAAVAITPLFVYVDASLASFQFYVSGVYDDPECSPTLLDHALLLVGYGTTPQGVDYWICKNSWGPSWGMEGYIQIARNKGNRCGLATNASYPY